MFDDILCNIKAHSAKVTESLSLENLRVRTSRLSDNFDSLKTHTTKLSESILTTLKKSAPRYLLVHQSDEPQTSILPADANAQGKHALKWPILVDNKMQWVTLSTDTGNTPNTDDDDDEDIVERFIRVISVDEEKSFTQVRHHKITFINVMPN
jgi:hypothetical protein